MNKLSAEYLRMRKLRHKTLALGLAALGVASLTQLGVVARAADPQRIVVPAFFGPDYSGSTASGCGPRIPGRWAQIEQGFPTAQAAILNPASGPGTTKNFDFACQVDRTRSIGVQVLGYVDTSFASILRPASAVKADIDTYYNFYGVDGIYFDQVPTSCSSPSILAYYSDVASHLRAKAGLHRAIFGHGAYPVGDCYMQHTDTALVFEGPFTSHQQASSPPGWASDFDSNRFWEVVFATSSSQLSGTISRANSRRAGFVYVTDDGVFGGNPYDTMPSYWTTEVALVAGSPPPPPPPAPPISALSATNNATQVFYEANYAPGFTHHRVFIDTDTSATSGFAIGGVGADYMIENATLYRHTGLGNGFSFMSLATANPTITGQVRRWTVERSTIGETQSTGETARVLFQASGPSGDAITLPIVHNYSGPPPPPSGPISAFSATNDASNVFYQADYAAASGFNVHRVFIDTDASSSTGFAVGGIGAEYKIENGQLFQHFNFFGTPLFFQLASANEVVTGETRRWTIPRSFIGEIRPVGETAHIVFQADGLFTSFVTSRVVHNYT